MRLMERRATDRERQKGKGEGEESEWTLDKVASLGLAGVLSIAVAESVFWILSFPLSELLCAPSRLLASLSTARPLLLPPSLQAEPQLFA